MWARTLQVLVWLNIKLSLLSIKLVRWTSKSTQPLHPKHLTDLPFQHWYLEHIRPGEWVLDVGCGSGMHTLKVASRVTYAVGIDYHSPSLDVAWRLRCDKGLNNVLFLKASAEFCLPFADATFDKVLLLDVIEHVHNRVELLREIGRVLRPEGAMLLSAPNRESRWKQVLRRANLPYYADPDHKIEYTLLELAAELSAADFTIVGRPSPVVLETPLAGLIDAIGGISLSFYRRLSAWKILAAQRYPQDTTGWRVVCQKVRKSESCSGECKFL